MRIRQLPEKLALRYNSFQYKALLACSDFAASFQISTISIHETGTKRSL